MFGEVSLLFGTPLKSALHAGEEGATCLLISRARLDDNLKSAEHDMPALSWRALQETNSMMERSPAVSPR